MHVNVSFRVNAPVHTLQLRLQLIVIAINRFNAHQYSNVFVIVFMTDFKEQGNRLFSERRYTEAIEAYTSAIVSTFLRP